MSNVAPVLRSIVERIERLKSEQDERADGIREIYAEAKSQGFDKTALGQAIAVRRKRKKNPSKFEELSGLVENYMAALEGRTKLADIERAHTHEEKPAAKPVAAPAKPDHSDPGPIPAVLGRRNLYEKASGR